MGTVSECTGYRAAKKTPSEYGSGEGTVCVSDEAGSAGFLAALAAENGVTDAEKKALVDARKSLNCSGALGGLPAVQVQSPAAKEFADYLGATKQFYIIDHTYAAGFAALTNANQPWVREAAHYMRARVALLAAQSTAFDEYGTLQKDSVSHEKIIAALDSLYGYLKDFPKGAYATSATGLLRRAYWLSGDAQKQATAYSEILAKSKIDGASLALVNELDLKLPEAAYRDSTLDVLFLAIEDLRQMREHTDDNGKVLPGMKTDVIEAQHARFSTHEDLYAYLLAARTWSIDKDAKAVLQLLPEKPAAGDALNYLEFSIGLLRAAALEAMADKSARTAIVDLFPKATQAYQRGTLELALAMLDERSKNISAIFAPDSLVHAPAIRQQVLDYLAGPILLRKQATATDVPQTERDIALYRLYTRDLTQGRFKGFLDDIKLIPPKPALQEDDGSDDYFQSFRWQGNRDAYRCPDLIETVRLLVNDAHNIQGRLCLGDFFRMTGITMSPIADKAELGGTGTLFAGKAISRQDYYIDIIRNADATHEEKAYALFRAVHCYEPSHINDCGGVDVAEDQRNKWYNELKANYADTTFARELHYFW